MELNNINISKAKKLVKGYLYRTSKVKVQVVQLLESRPSFIELVKKKIQDYSKYQLEKEKLIQKLDHQNIVRYERLYNNQEHKIMIIYMEYLKKGSLRHIIKSLHSSKKKRDQGQLELFAGVIAFEILKGLIYMEKKKIFHRDLKPDNICIGKLGEIKLVDFGSSTELELNDYYCETETGTRCYMAPEIYIRGKYKPDKSDVWSLGIMLFEFVFGKHPFLEKENFGKEGYILEKYNFYCNKGFKLDFECCIPGFKVFIRNMLDFDYKKRKSFGYFIGKNGSFLRNRVIGNIYLKKDFNEFIKSFENQKLDY